MGWGGASASVLGLGSGVAEAGVSWWQIPGVLWPLPSPRAAAPPSPRALGSLPAPSPGLPCPRGTAFNSPDPPKPQQAMCSPAPQPPAHTHTHRSRLPRGTCRAWGPSGRGLCVPLSAPRARRLVTCPHLTLCSPAESRPPSFQDLVVTNKATLSSHGQDLMWLSALSSPR